MYRPLGARQKDISTRLMKPTCPDIRIKDVLHLVKNWDPAWEFDGDITVSIALINLSAVSDIFAFSFKNLVIQGLHS